MRNGLILCLLAFVCSTCVWSQPRAGSGEVTGTVTEGGGDGLPDATVVLTNQALGFRRVMTTTDDGVFDAPALVPLAGYRLKVTRKGFTDWQSSEFQVSIGQTADFKISLERGTESARSGGSSTPRVADTKTGITTLTTQGQVEALPSVTRRLDPLVRQAPLVSVDQRNGQTVVAGVPSSNMFLADGIASTSTYSARPGVANLFSTETVQEFQTLSANYPSEFGNAMGGVVNAVTRSGSNNYHGSAYEYFTTQGLVANQRYAMGNSLLQRQNQFGATLGGPVQHDRIFFFANVEALDGRGDGLNRITSPVLADPFGISIPTSTCKATAAQCTAAIKFIQSQMNVLVPLTDRWVNGMAKIDYRRSERNNFNFTVNAMNARSPNGGPIEDVAANGGLLGINNSKDQTRYAKAAWTSAPTQNSLNELRLGLFEDRLLDPASQTQLSTGNIGITVAGATVGDPHSYSSSLNERRLQFGDNISITSNTHSFRAGGDLWGTRDVINSFNSAGTYVYPSLTAFAQDFTTGGRDYTYFMQDFGNPLRSEPSREYNLYALDTWRPFPTLTLIAGVRWEKPRLPQPSQANPSYYQTGTIASPNIDFAPRISAAWLADDRTVVRFGYGWFYAPMPGQLLDALLEGNGVNLTGTIVNPNQTGAPAFPNVVSASSILSGTTDLMYSSNKLRNPHTQEFTLAVERNLGHDTTLTISAVRSRGFKLWSVSDINQAIPTTSKTYAIDNASGQQVSTYTTLIWNTKNDPKFAHIYDMENAGGSWYSAVAADLRKRMSHGISVQASYTWSKSITNATAPTLAGYLPVNTTNGDVLDDKGPAPTDQRHRISVNWVWQPTVAGSVTPAFRHLVNGWSLSGLATMASSQNATPLLLVSGQQFSGITMQYTDSLNGSGGWPRVPFEPIGSLSLGPQYNLDARLSRSIQFTERIKGIVTFEAFNALNTQFNTSINTVAYTAVPTAPPAGAVNGPTTGVLHAASGVGTGNAGSPARMGQVAFRVVF
jgi:hypothetical protein